MRFQFEELGRIFPIFDATSARLMKIKARSLYGAGVITAEQQAEINRRANDVIFAKRGWQTLRAAPRFEWRRIRWAA